MSEKVLVWGNGSVGSGLAVILSRKYEVMIMGPPGCSRRTLLLSMTGGFTGKAGISQMPVDSKVDSDFSLIAVKATDLQVLGNHMRSGGGSFPAVCVTNGMGLGSVWGPSWERDIQPAVLTAGFDLTAGGMVLTSPGKIIADAGSLACRLFEGTSLAVETTGEIDVVRWSKWLVNSAINPLGALTGLRNCQLKEVGLRPVISILVEELMDIVPEGIRDEVVGMARDTLEFLLSSSDNFCSMLQDVRRGSETEIDFLTGLCGRKPPGSCPVAQSITALVKARVSPASWTPPSSLPLE